MEAGQILPLGTVVYIKEGFKKIMIVGRRLMHEKNGRQYYFDYTGCLYPEGVMGDQAIFFNEDDISKIIALGYDDQADESEAQRRILDWEESTTIVKADRDFLDNLNKG